MAATSEAVKQILYRLLVDGQSAIAGFKAAATAGSEYRTVLTQLAQGSHEIVAPSKDAKDAIQQTGDAGQKAAPQVNQFSQALHAVVGELAGVLGLQKVLSMLSEAGDRFLEYSQAVFTLEVSVRGLQRAGLDTTLEDWDKEIVALQKQFGIFSKVAVTEAVSQTALMTRNFGFTKDQMSDLVKTSMVLSEVTGKDLTETIRGLTFAIGSGYTEGVQRMGLNISKASLQQEALNEGYKEAWNDLDPLVRAQITYNAIIRETSMIMADAGRVQETSAGKMMKATADLENATLAVGESVAPWKILATFIESLFVQLMAKGLHNATQLFVIFVAGMYTGLDQLSYIWNNTMDLITGNTSWETFQKKNAEFAEFSTNTYKNYLLSLGKIFGLVDSTLGNTGKVLDDVAAKAIKDTKIMNDTLDKFESDVKELRQKDAQAAQDALTDYGRKMSDIQLNYQRDVEDINRDFNNRRANLDNDFRNKQYDEEKKFQEKMLELREQYLFDLEDAVRERDARKVLQLNRQYNLDRQQELRKYADSKEAALRDLAYQKQVLEIERQLRLQDRLRRRAEDQADAAIDLQRKLADIEAASRLKLAALMDAMIAEDTVTKEGMQRVYSIIYGYYGPGGAIDALYARFAKSVAQMNAAIAVASKANYATTLGSYVGLNPGLISGAARGYAEGGSLIATKPTLAMFGEAGPERVDITPLSRNGADVGKVFGDTSAAGGGGATIRIALGEGLEAKIIDNALGTAARLVLTSEG